MGTVFQLRQDKNILEVYLQYNSYNEQSCKSLKMSLGGFSQSV